MIAISRELTEVESSRLAFLKALLSEHLEDAALSTNEKIENCDLTVIDGYVSGLVAIFCRLEGDLERLNGYYKKAGLAQKFSDLVIDVYAIVDKVLARLTERHSKVYFRRLQLMASVMLDICLPLEDELSQKTG